MLSLLKWLSCQMVSVEEVQGNNDHYRKVVAWFWKELECWCCPSATWGMHSTNDVKVSSKL
jgi:hypothetical protein